MKSSWKKSILPAALALTLISPAAAYAASTSPSARTSQDTITTSSQAVAGQVRTSDPSRGHRIHKRHDGAMMGANVHHQTYIKLLVEKYAPETMKDWEPVLAESQRLHEELRSIRSSRTKGIEHKWKDDVFSKEMKKQRKHHMEIYKQFTEAIKSEDAGKIKGALADLLVVCKQRNGHLTKILEQLKAKHTTISSGFKETDSQGV
ncbi:hypothetical protein [Paenibacillus abyssi]|uniref:Uncharacterized protein n=1 Tax=Paenibacillus abyssi TaxID=1340531 RepID=A0A917D1Y1_9BACL|nr:hypothetical protein [Paenibacillus abyssi]GGG09143.1 hypothetical protein GCM10010916_27490 [Paenibacillus abyssi]